MDSSSNRVSKKLRVDGGMADRISGLPNDILGKILSFLPTKHAVETSCLSKRWEYVWTSISDLDFDDQLLYNDDYWINFDEHSDNPNCFKGFVDRVFLHCDSTNIQKFSLNVNELSNFPYVYDWICAAVNLNAHFIHISIGVDDDSKYMLLKSSSHAELPINFFTSKTLESLDLRWWNVSLKLPTSFNLPNLKLLHMSMFNPSLDFTEQLFSSCPLLEKLHISIQLKYLAEEIENYEEERKLVVTSTTLKVLEVSWTFDLPSGIVNRNHGHEVVINAPNVRCLSILDGYMAQYDGVFMPLLEQAYIDVGVGCICNHRHNQWNANQVRRIFKLFTNISQVKTLGLSHSTLDALTIPEDFVIPVFQNLTKLELGFSGCFDAEIFLRLLANATNLSTLILNKDRGHKITPLPAQFIWRQIETPACLLDRLKTIEILGIDGTVYDLELVKYFLQSAKILDTIKISSLDNKNAMKKMLCSGKYRVNNVASETVMKFNKEIFTCHKASKHCKIEFGGDFSYC